jgi:uncharacterized protein DUF6134
MRVMTRILSASTMTLLLGLADQAPAQTPAGSMRFAILRNGDQIGTHAIEISRSGQETNVRVTTELTVKVLFVTAYHLQHNASERWVNGQLMAFNSSTDANGTKHKVSATMGAAGLEIDADGKTSRVDKSVMPASLWNPELMRRKSMLDPQDGQVDPLAIVDSGTEELTFDGRSVKAHHYQMKSRYSQDVWYDERGRLVQVKLVGSDGSVISYKPL